MPVEVRFHFDRIFCIHQIQFCIVYAKLNNNIDIWVGLSI